LKTLRHFLYKPRIIARTGKGRRGGSSETLRGQSSKSWRDDLSLWLSLGQFVISTCVSLATVFVLLLYDGRMKDLDTQLKVRNVQRMNQSPLAFHSSVDLEPYAGGAYHLVTLNYAFQNIGADPVGVRQVVVRTFVHKAVPLARNPQAALAPSLDRAGCNENHDSWLEYARPEIYDARVTTTKIRVADENYTPAQHGGGLAELESKMESGGSAVRIVRASSDEFLGFLVCVEYTQVVTGSAEVGKIKKYVVVLRAKNGHWTNDRVRE
jgi:hypothetical protein